MVMKSSLIISALLLMSACSSGSIQKDFACPVQNGKPCTTMSEAAGVSGSKTGFARLHLSPAKTKYLTPSFASNFQSGALGNGSPQHFSPSVTGRIWIAGRRTPAGIVEEERIIHAILRPALPRG